MKLSFIAVVAAAAVSISACGSSETQNVTPSNEMGVTQEAQEIFSDVTVEGEDLSEYDLQAEIDPAVGEKFPTITGRSITGENLTVPSQGAKVVVVFAHYSPVAQAFLKQLSDYEATNSLTDNFPDVSIYAVSTNADPGRDNFPPANWLAVSRWPWVNSTLADSESKDAARAIGGAGVPFFVAVAPDGTVVAREIGNISPAGFAQLLEAAQTGVKYETIERSDFQ